MMPETRQSEMDEFEQYRAQAYNFSSNHHRSKSLPPRRRRKPQPEDAQNRGGSFKSETPKGFMRGSSIKSPLKRSRRRTPSGEMVNDCVVEEEYLLNSSDGLRLALNRLKLDGTHSLQIQPLPTEAQINRRVFLQSFEMKERSKSPAENISPQHRRAYSCRKPRPTRAEEVIADDRFRPRTSSLPTRQDGDTESPCALIISPPKGEEPVPELPEGVYRVRSFQTTSKGIVNRGDSFKRRSRGSHKSTASGSTDPGSMASGSHSSESSSQVFVDAESEVEEPSAYRVLVLGSGGVGKTALTTQFMTSEYMGHVDTFSEKGKVKIVSVMLDGEESFICFDDNACSQGSTYLEPADAYVIVYSLVDGHSFEVAVTLLRHIRQEVSREAPAVILVGNKSDIVRNREISVEEAKRIAMMHACKYIEVSAVLNHNIDELLVGILRQIRLNTKNIERPLSEEHSICAAASTGCVRGAARGLLHKIFLKSTTGAKPCDDLMAP